MFTCQIWSRYRREQARIRIWDIIDIHTSYFRPRDIYFIPGRRLLLRAHDVLDRAEDDRLLRQLLRALQQEGVLPENRDAEEVVEHRRVRRRERTRELQPEGRELTLAPLQPFGSALSGKLDRARSRLAGWRSRLYRSQILQVNMRSRALAEIYTMHCFALL